MTSHPEWFTTQADGTIAYAENPPKKYQDIYPLNFDNDPQGICKEVLRLVRHWMSHGVRIFRVDNPHTKPVAFWEWLLREVRRTDPDVIFLAEAFTRPAMMQTLGAIGFQQSYTYFTWRTAKWEIEEYLREVSSRHRPPDATELLRQHSRHPPCVPAVRRPRRRSRSARCWPPPARRAGACTPATSSTSTSPSGPGARSTWTRRSTRSGSATGRPPMRRAAASRRTSRSSTPYAAPIPRSSSCATWSSTPATTRTCWCSASRSVPGLDRLDRRDVARTS